MPASARRRVVRVLVDAGLIIALCAVTERCCGILFAVGAVVLLIAVMTAMMAMTGATPGGLVTGVRLRRVADTSSPPGRSAVIYVAFLGLSLVATAGLAPHALFVPASDGVLITDLGSTNGTHVEDEEGVHRLSPGRPEYVHRGRQAYLGDGVCIVR